MGTMSVPEVIPIFPLSGTVLLPGEMMPLHIFELRYRDMVRDALAGQGIIGMVQPRRGFEEDLAGSPPVREVGCAGIIARHFELPDGRFLIWLLGLSAFRIRDELKALTRYRQVRIAPAHPGGVEEVSGGTAHLRAFITSSLTLMLDGAESRADVSLKDLEAANDEQLIAAAAQMLGLSGERKQAILETADVMDRFLLLNAALGERLGEQAGLLSFDRSEVN